MASPVNASLRQRITTALSGVGQTGMTAGDIAKEVGKRKKEVNAELYQRMMPEGLVEQAYTGNPPLWRLKSTSNSSATSPPDPPTSVPDPQRSVSDPPRTAQDQTIASIPSLDPSATSVLPVDARLLPDPQVNTRPQQASLSNTLEPECSNVSSTARDGRSHSQGSDVPHPGDKENSLSGSAALDANILQALEQPAEPKNVFDVKKIGKDSLADHIDVPETETLEDCILQVLRQSQESLSALNIAKRVGKKSAGDVNPTLYKLEKTYHIQRRQLPGESKPLWFANPNLQTPSRVSSGGIARSTPLATMTESENSHRLYSREDRDDGQIVFTPHKADGNSSPTQKGDQSEPLSSRRSKRGKPQVGLAAVFPSSDKELEVEEDKKCILKLFSQRPASEWLETSKISEKLGHPTRSRAMIALKKLKKEGKVLEDFNDEVSLWSLAAV